MRIIRLLAVLAALLTLGGVVSTALLVSGLRSVQASGPALRSVSTKGNHGTIFTASAPAGEAANDVLLAALQINGSGTITAPSGWTLIGSTAYGSDTTYSYVKVAGAAEPASYTWSSTAYSNGSISILDYTGISTTSPINAWAGNSGASATAVAPAVTTTAPTVSVVLVTWDGSASSLAVTTPTGYTQRWFQNSYEWTYGADALTSAPAGTLPTVNVATNPGDLYTTQRIALTVDGPTPTPTNTPTATPTSTPGPSPTPTAIPTPTPPPNAIQIENSQPGDPSWGSFAANCDPTLISGYGSQISVNRGQSIDFYVTTTDLTFTMDIYRMGWYGGAGGRHMASLGTFPGVNQPQATPDAVTGVVAENWSPTTTFAVPSSWTTGVYLVKLTSASGNSSFIYFVVRDDGGHEKYIFQTSVTTYEAYNTYGGTSLYNNRTNGSIYSGPHAVKVSFDRPFNPCDSNGAGHFLWYEYPMLRWLEKNGYDMTYITDVDTDTNINPLTNHKAFLSVGHDEYWSMGMHNNVTGAINAGVNVGFFAADESYWQIRFEPNAAGVQNRIEVGYKDFSDCGCFPGPDPMWNVNNSILTNLWRSSEVNMPENAFIGVMFGGEVNNANYVVQNSSSWVYAGTGFTDGTVVPGIVGYEYDHVANNGLTPAGFTQLSNSPVNNSEQHNAPDIANSGIYTAPSGARVFAAGTIQWSYGLDSYGGTNFVNAGIQKTTANILANFGS